MAVSNGTDSVTATLTLNDIDVKFQLDTAADVNTICQRHVRQHQVSSTTVRLNMWNKTNLKPLGETQPLNAALKRQHYRLPVFDDVLPKLKDAKIFSKLDVKEAYWHVLLDEASSKLTTMNTPFGRYMRKRLPFGLKVSSEIFQRKIDEELGDLDGVFNIVDDVVIVGCGNSDAEAQSDNQQKLAVTMKRCAKKNIILNEDKRETGLDEILFHGHRITKDGVKLMKPKCKLSETCKHPLMWKV